MRWNVYNATNLTKHFLTHSQEDCCFAHKLPLWKLFQIQLQRPDYFFL